MNDSTIQSQPLFQKSFGSDFDLGIQLPAHFTDISFSNDVCPSFEFECGAFPNLVLKLWIDFENEEQREMSDSQRYTIDLYRYEDHSERIFESDDAEACAEFINSADALTDVLHEFSRESEPEPLTPDFLKTATEAFAEWYLFRQPSSIRLASIRCWLEVNYPAHKDSDILLWEIWDGYSEYLPESY